MSEWITLRRYNEYAVNERGEILSKKSDVIMKPYITNSGYYQVKLYQNGRHHHEYIHRLVAETFIGDFDVDTEVNHMDGNKLNNAISNLELCSRSENTQHAIRTGLFTPYKLPPHPHESKRVRIIETGETFDSLTECANHIGGFKTAVSACLLGKVKTHKGYHFEEV